MEGEARESRSSPALVGMGALNAGCAYLATSSLHQLMTEMGYRMLGSLRRAVCLVFTRLMKICRTAVFLHLSAGFNAACGISNLEM